MLIWSIMITAGDWFRISAINFSWDAGVRAKEKGSSLLIDGAVFDRVAIVSGSALIQMTFVDLAVLCNSFACPDT